MAELNLSGYGFSKAVDVTGAKTLAAVDSGVVQNVTADAVLTLPATAAGASFIVRVGASNATIAVSPASADQILGNGFTATDNKALIFTDQPIGSYVKLVGDGSLGYYVAEVHGVATREA